MDHQALIPQFFTECTADQRPITNLLHQNKNLKDQIADSDASFLVRPNFLRELLEHSIENQDKKQNQYRYTEHLKEISLYIYVMSGPTVYMTLSNDLKTSMPSLSSIRRALRKKERTLEGHFRFSEIKEQMEKKGDPLYVVTSEDDTKSSDVHARWEFVRREFEKIGVIVVCFSTDGASSFTKTMQHIMDIPTAGGTHKNCPQVFKWFFGGGSWNLKGFRNLITRNLTIGSFVASRATLLAFLTHVGKPERTRKKLRRFATSSLSIKDEVVTVVDRAQRYINFKNYKKHIFLKRDLESGKLTLIQKLKFVEINTKLD